MDAIVLEAMTEANFHEGRTPAGAGGYHPYFSSTQAEGGYVALVRHQGIAKGLIIISLDYEVMLHIFEEFQKSGLGRSVLGEVLAQSKAPYLTAIVVKNSPGHRVARPFIDGQSEISPTELRLFLKHRGF